MILPENYIEKMRDLLDDIEFDLLKNSYDEQRSYGLRANTLKIPSKDLRSLIPELGDTVPWADDGFYYPESINPGKLAYHMAGLYYIQEPSAMYPVGISDIKEGMKILDLCASPGGKTVQIAAKLKNTGILVCNDNNPKRISALIKNIELYGIRNTVVFNVEPEELTQEFESYFDKIFVDAPCSGEGMFRKDESLIKSYPNKSIEEYTSVQSEILNSAHKMLSENGQIIYSTCTFNNQENEGVINKFLDKHKNYLVYPIKKHKGIEKGFNGLDGASRLWPYKIKGEGHFTCIIHRTESINKHYKVIRETGSIPESFKKFSSENLNCMLEGEYFYKGNSLHFSPYRYEGKNKVRYIKRGIYLGDSLKNRFIPSHPLILSLMPSEIKRSIYFHSDGIEMNKYLKGETLIIDSEKGFTGVLCDGYTIGWAKQTGRMLKNLYPKTWRKLN